MKGIVIKPERATQDRVVRLFCDKLGYSYLGNWEEREGNANIEIDLLRSWLAKSGKYSDTLIEKAIRELARCAAMGSTDELYTVNKAVYEMLRYGASVKEETGQNNRTVAFIDWDEPQNNDFAIAEEVSIKAERLKRPDIVLYINGIAVGVLELKRASVSVSEGIRQNITNQQNIFIKHFFSTVTFVLAGNDSSGLHYGTTKTGEKYFLKWKEDGDIYEPDRYLLDKHIEQFCGKKRLLDVMHNFVIFDSGTKKLCRPNQYFGVSLAMKHIARKEGGIIWHTQGSGKSLTMVWLAKRVLETNPNARVLIVTDRVELDEQIEQVFGGVGEKIERMSSAANLITKLNATTPRLMCSLVHKFGARDDDNASEYIKELSMPSDFEAKGEFVVFIDECHRTQSGELHKAMKALLPNATFIGFTGTPLLKKDKKKSIEVFGRYIHTYKFDEAVRDGVVLDLLYEARDVDQHIVDQKSVDEWFELVTQGMNELPKAELKQKWGTMQKVLSTKSRLEKIVFDIKKDFLIKPRLKSGRGNAMLVAASIYEACRYYEIFTASGFKKCAIVTSFEPNAASTKNEHTGEGDTEKVEQYEIYQKMLKEYGYKDRESFEKFAKKSFKEEPANMQLLIVVDKLLTGFDAVGCTYLYIDKKMRDHGLFQAICRTNRLGKEEENDPYYKDFGYIIDYQNLFGRLESAIGDYTSDAFDAFEAEDVKGLLTDRLKIAKERLEDAIEALHRLCEPVAYPKDTPQYFAYFVGNSGSKEDLARTEDKRLLFYKLVVSLIRAYNNIASEIVEAGYTKEEAENIKIKVNDYVRLRDALKEYSGDYIDMKKYEPDMRAMLDMYLSADPSRVLSKLGEASLLELIVDIGADEATDKLSDEIKKSKESVSETIENNISRTIVQEMPLNPAYYEQMSILLEELIKKRRDRAIEYEELLKEYEELAKKVVPKAGKTIYPPSVAGSLARQALYDNLGQNENLAVDMHEAIMARKPDDFRGSAIKQRAVKNIIRDVLASHGITGDDMIEKAYNIILAQKEY